MFPALRPLLSAAVQQEVAPRDRPRPPLPFAPPGYQVEDVEARGYTVAFDVVRCPVADYFAARGLSDLCVALFCDLDQRLAGEWGADLVRSGTIAGGQERCDFRWQAR